MRWIGKNKLLLLILFLISALYFALRLPNLTLQPIFADEAIYIRWAQIMKSEPTLRFLPLSDGKTPLFMWAMIPFFKIFEDPLFAGRFLSVLSGFFTLLGISFIGWRFFNARVGLLGALLIAVTPYIVFFDRMALVDSMLTVFTVWSLALGLLLIQSPRWDLAMLLGYLMGGGLLTKPSGVFNLISLPATILTFNWLGVNKEGKLVRIFFTWGVAVIITLIIYNILRLGPGFTTMNSRNQDYIFLPQEIKDRIWDPFIPHFRDISEWWPKLLTLPILMMGAIGVSWGIVSRNKHVLSILVWTLIPLIVQMMFLRTFTTRYILFSIPPLLLLTAWGVDQLCQRFKKYNLRFMILGAGILAVLPLILDYQLLTNPFEADLPRESKRGYFEEWTAGYGLDEVAKFLIIEAKKESIVVGTEGSFGTLPDGLEIYLDKYHHLTDNNHKISVVGGKATISAQLKQAALDHPTYYVANRAKNFPVPSELKLLKEYPKVIGPTLPQEAIMLFKVIPSR